VINAVFDGHKSTAGSCHLFLFKREGTLIFSSWDEIELSGRYVIIPVIFVAVQYSGNETDV